MTRMAEFQSSVETGLKLAKRVYAGKDRGAGDLAAPSPAVIDKSPAARYDPSSPAVYAVVPDPAVVDNPDIPSYQPHVHGRCDPPALIPLHMTGVKMELDCYLDRVFVSVRGSWRVHCVMASRSCDCLVVVPMGDQGSILGAEIEVAGKSYSTKILPADQTPGMEKMEKLEEGSVLKPNVLSVTVPRVDGGSILSVKVSWFQPLLYEHGQFCIAVPFSFPEFVNPSSRKVALIESITLSLNTGFNKEVILKGTSHPMKETRRQNLKLGFQYDAQVSSWSKTDFSFSFEVSSSDVFGGVFLQSPSLDDHDQREMFCLYLFPGKDTSRKAFRKEVVFMVDISGSMGGIPLDCAKKAIADALAKFTPKDMFNIIAFNGETFSYSSNLKESTAENIETAIQWMEEKFVAGGGTNFLNPLKEAMKLLSDTSDSIPHILLVTDGSVDDERSICQLVESHIDKNSSLSPRISTFGIGSYCNHYFLRMLAMISRGHYDAVFEADMIEVQIQRFFRKTLSSAIANISIDMFDTNDDFEVYPSPIPDLSSEAALVVSGRYQGHFPSSIKANGLLADMTNSIIDVKVQQAKDIPLDKAFAKQQIELLTAQAWYTENKELVDKIAKTSMQTAFVSEFTRMVLVVSERENLRPTLDEKEVKKLGSKKNMDVVDFRVTLLPGLNLGFGNIVATTENVPPELCSSIVEPEDTMLSKTFREVGSYCNCCCCVYCIGACSKVNDQCAIVLTQFCTALSCFGCLSCCIAVCCPDVD